MPVAYDQGFLRRLISDETLRDTKRRKRISRSYEGIFFALSLLYGKQISDNNNDELVNTIKDKFNNKELYFDLCYLFELHEDFQGLLMEDFR